MPPGYDALPTNDKLPDPFMSTSGVRITGSDQWECRRAEIKSQARKYELGSLPTDSTSVTGSFDGSNINVVVSSGAKSISFSAKITYPTTGEPPYPAMIGISGIFIGEPQLNAMGVATIAFNSSDIADDADSSSRSQGGFYQLYPPGQDTGAMMAWAWGVGRLIDAIEQLPEANIDVSRLGVTGCSRYGKGALIVGAFEDRLVLTIPQESGSGGSASWRVSDWMLASGTQVQTLSEITGENVWFTPSFSQFNQSATKLPFDHHMIEGLVAPRALLVIENTSQVWLGNISTFTDSMTAHMIWEGLGIPDKMGFSQIGDHAHCEWNGSQQHEVTAYVQKFLIGQAGVDGGDIDTSILKTDGGFVLDENKWIDWAVPSW